LNDTESDDENTQTKKYLQFKKKIFLRKNKKLILFQIIDISNKIMYGQSKAKREFLSLINASVSHELRNPLNSIVA
jgi:signal transduction histidine kinase